MIEHNQRRQHLQHLQYTLFVTATATAALLLILAGTHHILADNMPPSGGIAGGGSDNSGNGNGASSLGASSAYNAIPIQSSHDGSWHHHWDSGSIGDSILRDPLTGAPQSDYGYNGPHIHGGGFFAHFYHHHWLDQHHNDIYRHKYHGVPWAPGGYETSGEFYKYQH